MDILGKHRKHFKANGLFVSCLLVLLLGVVHVRGQELTVDLREVNGVVDSWTKAHKDKDLSALDQLYAEEVILYVKRVPKANCLDIKSKIFQTSEFFDQEIVSKPVTKVYDNEVIRTSFVRRVTSGIMITDYDAYLLLRKIDGELRIIGESDLTRDGQVGFIPDLGSELKTSLLSVRKAQMEKSFWGNVYLILLTLLSGVALVGLAFLLLKVREARNERIAIVQDKDLEFFQSRLGEIRNAVAEFAAHVDVNTGYFSNSKWKDWENLYSNLYHEAKEKYFAKLPQEELRLINTFKRYFAQGESRRTEFNKTFLIEENKRYSTFFDNIEGRKLDNQQRNAILKEEDNSLVIAGAGSGKTSTIVGKVRYLIDRYKVAPREILLISFTNKSATTLAARTGVGDFEAKTFHKLGKDIIAGCEGKQPNLFDEKQFRPLLKRYFNELLRDPSYLSKVTEYFVNFLKPDKPQSEFQTQGDYIQYLKDQNFRTYKQVEVSSKSRTTYKMEVVKSIEECRIANFLLFNGVDYEYERPYEFNTATKAFRQYKPDFTIKQNETKIYLEHFGISRDGSVPAFFAKDGETQEQASAKYRQGIQWKRDLHLAKHTKLIESYSYEMREESLFDNLTLKLSAAGITLKPKTPGEIWRIILDAASDEVDGFITLFGTFITLMKSNNYSIHDVRERNQQSKDDFFRRRNDLFLDLVNPLYASYGVHLRARGEIDFSDMINQAITHVRQGRYKRKYRHIIIDEFQDISIGRYQLVKAIKQANPTSKLFCVGDDWQSIYRFSGSDLALFKDFEKYFGYTERSRIETTYRFHHPLIKLSSDFIQRNPNQTRKDLKGASASKSTTYKIHYSLSKNQDDTLVVQAIFNQLAADPDIEKKEIHILGRYSFDIDRLKNENRAFVIDKASESLTYTARGKSGAVKTLRAQFMTVHKSKGLEADIVIILNCNSGRLGFPSKMSDDPVLNLLLSEADQYAHGEERRLFYVAMTRARESVHFVADHVFKSTFINELEMKTSQSPNPKCPDCKRGDLIVKKAGTAKNGNKYTFYGCTNYDYGCEYSMMAWEKGQGTTDTGTPEQVRGGRLGRASGTGLSTFD